ncbi:MAG: 4Fe-4S binding protein [Acidobacteriota bacterium]|nr:MAG: 4Fe-4S binding protein [Acidobacteriota bacterium]
MRAAILSSRPAGRREIVVCGGTGCRAAGSLELFAALERELTQQRASDRFALKMSGCHGFCQQAPLTVIEPERVFYCRVGRKNLESDVGDMVQALLSDGEPVRKLLYRHPVDKERIVHYEEIPFYAQQTRIVLRNAGRIDPRDIDDYLARGGYGSLAKVLSMQPADVIAEIEKAGLRGRGGAGFPTGRKWALCRAAADDSMRYVICNADEGDPGAFMDRSIIESDPHSVLEGMAIGSYAIAHGVAPAQGIVYIRAEYPLAVETLTTAIEQAKRLGLLGENILGSAFSFDVKIKRGAGAFVCGEETAMIASIEGRRGMPTARPPVPAVKGLFGKPTNINNVETWANVPRIIEGGADWFASIGSGESKGTKVFSLVGKINNSGLIEVPMGMSLRTIVDEIGGGVPERRQCKAVQTGGPSGGCIPAALLDTPVDYEHVQQVGSMMGSGGMVVMDEYSCMVDVAKYFLAFTESESCGKCVPCRMGTQHLLRILTEITEGRGTATDVETLQKISETMKDASLCGLGQTAPNPVLTTIENFADEYRAHTEDGKCPAGVCRELIQFTIDQDKCTCCPQCVRACPVHAISGEKRQPRSIDQEQCIRCGTCREVCKFDAIMVS